LIDSVNQSVECNVLRGLCVGLSEEMAITEADHALFSCLKFNELCLMLICLYLICKMLRYFFHTSVVLGPKLLKLIFSSYG